MEAEHRIGSWTASQLSDYVNGRMSASEAHKLESDMLDDPFLNEAVEGYSALGLGPDMQSLNEQWHTRSAGTSSGGSSVLGPIAIGVAVVAIIGIGAMFIQQSEVEEMAQEVSIAMEETRAQEQIFADSLEIMEIQLAIIIVAEKEIRPEETRKAQTAIKEQEEEQADIKRVSAPEALTPLGLEDVAKQDMKEIVEPTPPIFYLHDLKLADHRPEYETELYIQGEWMSGTAARYERERNGITQIPDIVQVNYESILSDAMAYFAARDYKSALLVLKRVEKRHPNDANVAFYGGLCYYNLSKFTKADIYFRRALDHSYGVFDQEARWYLALSLVDQEKFERARYHLRIIIDEGEFYANKAKMMMGGL